MDFTNVQQTIENCFTELQSASRDKYDTEKADKTAALFLTAQMQLSFLIEEIEIKSKNSKNEIERLEAEKYFEYKTSNSDKKITENMLSSYVAKDATIIQAKMDYAKYEAELKKWVYILNSLKDAHIFFRNIAKTKTWSE